MTTSPGPSSRPTTATPRGPSGTPGPSTPATPTSSPPTRWPGPCTKPAGRRRPCRHAKQGHRDRLAQPLLRHHRAEIERAPRRALPAPARLPASTRTYPPWRGPHETAPARPARRPDLLPLRERPAPPPRPSPDPSTRPRPCGSRASARQLHRQPLQRPARLRRPRAQPRRGGPAPNCRPSRPHPTWTATYAARTCAALAAAQTPHGERHGGAVAGDRSAFAYAPGQGGLQTSRLTCELVAETRVTGTVTFTDAFEQDRIGWREITAAGDGVRLAHSSVPATSVSDELRNYPDDLLSDPLDQRTATLPQPCRAGLRHLTPARLPAARDRRTPSRRSASPSSRSAARSGTPWRRWTALFTGLSARTIADRAAGAAGRSAWRWCSARGTRSSPDTARPSWPRTWPGGEAARVTRVIVGATVTATHTAGVLVVGLC